MRLVDALPVASARAAAPTDASSLCPLPGDDASMRCQPTWSVVVNTDACRPAASAEASRAAVEPDAPAAYAFVVAFVVAAFGDVDPVADACSAAATANGCEVVAPTFAAPWRPAVAAVEAEAATAPDVPAWRAVAVAVATFAMSDSAAVADIAEAVAVATAAFAMVPATAVAFRAEAVADAAAGDAPTDPAGVRAVADAVAAPAFGATAGEAAFAAPVAGAVLELTEPEAPAVRAAPVAPATDAMSDSVTVAASADAVAVATPAFADVEPPVTACNADAVPFGAPAVGLMQEGT